MAGELVVGYDGSECAIVALDEAVRIAKKFETSVVVIFSAHVPSALSGGAGDQRRVIEAKGEEFLQEARGRIEAAGVGCITRLVDDRPAEALVATAAEFDAEMIVVGTYSDRPMTAALVGSTPPKLLHLSEHPVLVVPVSQ